MLAESIVQDVRYALRGMRRSPLFAASVAGTIGIGLGILCSAFTIINAYLFKAVNLPEPQQLYALSWDTATVQRHEFSLADFEALAESNPVFSRLAAGRPVTTGQQGAQIFGHLVTPDYFGVVGGSAAMGRTITAADFAAQSDSAVIVLSHEGWRNHFNADSAIVGKEITLAGGRFVVIGVTPPNAVLPGDEQIGFWAPLLAAPVFGMADPAQSDGHALFVVGRRRADVQVERVVAWFDTWARQRFPSGTAIAPTRTRVDSLATRIPVNRSTVTLFSMLTAAFGLVLLVACANVTNMLLARGLGRQRELGVRLSLGAARSRIVRQLIIESLVLSVPAAVLGLALTYFSAWVFPRLVTATIPAGAGTASLFIAPFDPDVRVIALLIASGFLAALLAGLSPALQLTRTSLIDAMRGTLGPNTRLSRLRSVFVAVQIGTCVLFLVAAIGLVAESRKMATVDTGLDYQRVLDLRTSDSVRAVIARELATRGDVERVAAVWRAPIVSTMQFMRVALPGNRQQSTGFLAVSPEYFETMGVQVRRGRMFSELEALQDAAVVIVSENTARLFWPREDPIGQSLLIVPPANDTQRQPSHSRVTVIGVAEDVVNGTLLDGVARTTLYFPTTVTSPNVTRLLIRTRGDSAVALRSIAAAIEAAHPAASIQIAPLQERAALQVWSFNAFSTIAAIPAVIGVLLSFAGTYGVVAFVMAQRRREFGIRMALGATAGHIMKSVVGGTVRTAIVAAAIGLAATFGLIRGVSAVVGLVPVIDPWIYGAGTAVVIVAAAAASLLPAMGAIRLNPSMALRAD
ncbi:MAG: FtsX-like permease family protein [Vicinamibacterales bacterium]|jgi:predicted permease